MRYHNYYTYILTNKIKTVLYTGVTNDLKIRLNQHKEGNDKAAFTRKYQCYHLVYFEHFQFISQAITREKEIKGWTRNKKNALIEKANKDWRFLNDEIE